MWERILIVDDGQSLRHLLQTVLENAGYRVVLASDGEEAVRLAESGKPHLIILDAKMPHPDGINTCIALRANQKTRAIPIILATDSTESIARAREIGVDDFVAKPFHLPTVLTRVKAMLKVSHIEGKAERAAAYLKEIGRVLPPRQ